METAVLNALMQLPVVTVFIWYAIYVGREKGKAMQEERKLFIEALSSERKESRDQVAIIAESMEKMALQLERLTRALVYHDMTVRGINPKLSGSPEEMARFIETGSRT